MSAFGDKSNYGLSGRINVGYNHFTAFGGQQRFAPHGYSIMGGINGKIGAVDVPVNFTYTQLSRNISTPFNMLGASPYYKWIKLHLGHRNLNFSPTVLSGRTFFGAGIELTPGKFHFTTFSGTMQNLSVVRDSLAAGALVLPSFKRRIQGVKIGILNKANKFEIMGVRVIDLNPTSDMSFIPVLPVENLVLGVNVSLKLFKHITLNMNGSGSLFTSDRNAILPEKVPELLSRIDPIHGFNFSTRASFAMESSVRYSQKGYFIGLRYRRLDPYYFSLATNFLQNDIENVTVDFGAPILSKKLNLRGSIGHQRDNLRKHKTFTNNRFIGSGTLTYNPDKKLQLIVRYANFQQESQSGLVEVNDTFRILTTTHNIYFNTNWRFIEDDVKSVLLSLNLYNNQVIDEAAQSFRSQNNNFSGLGANGRISYQYKPLELSVGPVLNYNLFEFASYSQGRVGGGLHINKGFMENKITTDIQWVRQQNLFNGKGNGHNTNLAMNTRLSITKKQHLGMRMMYLNNQAILTPNFSELRMNVMYSLGF